MKHDKTFILTFKDLKTLKEGPRPAVRNNSYI